MQKKCSLLFISLLIITLLTRSSQAYTYAYSGLQIWYERMIPSLLPFMILSDLLIRLELAESFILFLAPIPGFLFRVSPSVCYCMFMGFLGGFPMGARTAAGMWEKGMISRREAGYILAFCNNLGPIYLCSYGLPALGITGIMPHLLILYGIPLAYGFLLRHTFYKDLQKDSGIKGQLCEKKREERNVISALRDSIQTAMDNMLNLCGYMVLFNLLNILPDLLLPAHKGVLAPLFEISGGIRLLGINSPLPALLCLSFGGLCCLAQTYSCLNKCPVSMGYYLLHKTLQTLMTGVAYLVWHLISPSTYLL